MTSDRYTRIVLTIIAACLVYLCVRDAVPPVQAQIQPQLQPLDVVLVGVDRRAEYRKYAPRVYTSIPWDTVPVFEPR